MVFDEPGLGVAILIRGILMKRGMGIGRKTERARLLKRARGFYPGVGLVCIDVERVAVVGGIQCCLDDILIISIDVYGIHTNCVACSKGRSFL